MLTRRFRQLSLPAAVSAHMSLVPRHPLPPVTPEARGGARSSTPPSRASLRADNVGADPVVRVVRRGVLCCDHERGSAVMRRSREPPADEEGRRLARWTVLRALQGVRCAARTDFCAITLKQRGRRVVTCAAERRASLEPGGAEQTTGNARRCTRPMSWVRASWAQRSWRQPRSRFSCSRVCSPSHREWA
jgi:hypothetical protein